MAGTSRPSENLFASVPSVEPQRFRAPVLDARVMGEENLAFTAAIARALDPRWEKEDKAK